MSLPHILCPWGASAWGQCTECPAASLLQAGMAKQLAQGRRIPSAGKGLAPAAFCSEVRSRLGSLCHCWRGKELCSAQAVILSSLEKKGLLLSPLSRAWPGPCSPGSGAKAPAARHAGQRHLPPCLACGPMAERSLPGVAAACGDGTNGLGGLGSSTHLLSVQYLVFCKSRV